MNPEEPTDLVCRARRGQLRPEEVPGFERCLTTVPEARLVHAILDEFEGESRVQPGDDTLVARIAARAATSPARRPRHFSQALLTALAVLLVGSVAGAWSAGLFTPSATPLACQPVVPAVSGSPSPPHQRGAAPASPGSAAVVSVVSLAPSVGRLPDTAVASHGPPADGRACVEPACAPSRRTSPAELLAAANLARREGRSGDAQRLYRTIVDGHAASREAPVARLALAKLLAGSAPGAALAHFEVLAASGGGLRAEALWGQAECARRLGRVAMERQALDALVHEFPTSAYAEVARGRIADGGR
ncbi:MAG: hypothetical protein JW751_20360 [Polyangiaceae bacterium]|nr:hypothetical protein [Polyangiaceae bacterium]